LQASLSTHIRYDQQNKQKDKIQIHGTNQSCSIIRETKSEKYKHQSIRWIQASINKLDIQDATGSDEKLEILPSSSTVMLCILTQVPQDIWVTRFLHTSN
jgi:hypothetical protein